MKNVISLKEPWWISLKCSALRHVVIRLSPAFPGVQWWQVCEEDPDRGGLCVAGQSRPSQASGELAQAACQHRPDPLIDIRKPKYEEVSDIRGQLT